MAGHHSHHHHHAGVDPGDRRVLWAVGLNMLLTLAQIVGGERQVIGHRVEIDRPHESD